MSAAAAASKSETNVKETIESILIAFILAFIFRCFVVEAFVIPTGSMAPTLMGAHLQFRCPDCGYRFAASFANQDETFAVPEDTNKVYGVICPNCGMRLPRSLANDPDNDADNPSVRYGDRILVMKYQYLLHPVRRWDVVVFKTPDTQRGTVGDYSVNYIKRLTGKPNERLFVAEGDLFVANNTGKPAVESEFVIQTKPRTAQDALWRIVYDADYVPIGLPRTYTNSRGGTFDDPAWRQPWIPGGGSGWTNHDTANGVTARQFAFDNLSGDGTLTFDPAAIPNTGPLTDWLAYDQTDQQVLAEHDSLEAYSYARRSGIVRNVPDLKLSAVIDRLDGDGPLRMIVGKTGDAEFVAEVTRDKIRLIKKIDSSSRTIGEVARPGGKVRLSLENVDYRVAVCVNGQEAIATSPAD
jgi:signal peptidase I